MQFATEERVARDTASTVVAAELQSEAVIRTPEELARIVLLFASSEGWMDRVRLRVEHRWYERVIKVPATTFG